MIPAQAPRRLTPWRVLQALFWIVGVVMVAALIFAPRLGQTLFWNVLIPFAPGIFVVAASLWRNVCPLATTSLLPDRLGLSRKIKIPFKAQQRLNLAGAIALFAIIPLRHVIFDNDPRATGFLLLGTAVLAVGLGFVFERKSAWCNGLCPIHPVERLYGAGVAFSVPNVHCDTCVNCALPCPDSLPTSQRALPKVRESRWTSLLMAGAFPGYVWGWFQQPDYTGAAGIAHLGWIYFYPAIGGLATLALYVALGRWLPKRRELWLNLFAAAAVSCYYWFRFPQLFGFNPMHSNDALVLVNLTGQLPGWSMIVLNLATTSFFVWWNAFRRRRRISWSPRPPYAAGERTKTVPT
ncbi:MAG TPA: hypothetical protein V6D47_04140 [Oscillatoriaceae cyanobacterium]